jgi:hypothetical protein
MGEEMLPKFDYHLDESDPDVVVLRRQDGSFVAAFSARGVTKESIVEAAREDYRTLLEKHGLPERGGAVERGAAGLPRTPLLETVWTLPISSTLCSHEWSRRSQKRYFWTLRTIHDHSREALWLFSRQSL